jgi:hypothetical protein
MQKEDLSTDTSFDPGWFSLDYAFKSILPCDICTWIIVAALYQVLPACISQLVQGGLGQASEGKNYFYGKTLYLTNFRIYIIVFCYHCD